MLKPLLSLCTPIIKVMWFGYLFYASFLLKQTQRSFLQETNAVDIERGDLYFKYL